MMPKAAVCVRAYRARDPRFDGRFYVGVLTTGVYCRPICPAMTPKVDNVRFFPSAAAAANAGLRPCLRCRPETSVGTPAWLGTSATVSRALRLIGEGALDGGSVEQLAQRLGIGARHLSRLFDDHLGASPLAVAQTRRLHFAKRLIDETNLPMTEVALGAGFGSVRHFNTLLRRTYGRTPSELRRGRRQAAAVNGGGVTLRLAYRPPLDIAAVIAFLARRATPGVERVEANSYLRTISTAGGHGTVELRASEPGVIELHLQVPEPSALLDAAERARRLFDLNANPTEIVEHLRRDRRLARRLRSGQGVRVPGSWDPFELAVRAILGQSISVAAATTLAGRLASRFGERFDGHNAATDAGLDRLFPNAQRLSVVAVAKLAGIGLPRPRARTIVELARAVVAGQLDLASTSSLESYVESLMRLPGIGEWTAGYIAMRALGDPDAFPAGDLVLRRSLRPGGERLTATELTREAEAWRPWRAYAAMLLWQRS